MIIVRSRDLRGGVGRLRETPAAAPGPNWSPAPTRGFRLQAEESGARTPAFAEFREGLQWPAAAAGVSLRRPLGTPANWSFENQFVGGTRVSSRERTRMKKYALVAAGLAAALLIFFFAIPAIDRPSPLTQTFNRIYAEGVWGRDVAKTGTSGSGSTLEITRDYRAYLQDFIKTHRVTSIVDAGCGDWSFSRTIDWADASYLGVDIASDVIEAVRKKHEKDKITFRVGDITEELPAADLLISKDVLQHLSNALVQKFIKNNLKRGKYKWVLLTNDRGKGNGDTVPGGYRAIDLSAPPFEVKGFVDLPITFGNEVTKVTSLLDLTLPP
jgi:SAM-dependent methyltransferase